MKLKAGQMVKVTNSYASGTVVTVQGRVKYLYDSALSNTLFVVGHRDAEVEVQGYSGGGASVTIELIPEPLPEALGSVIRYFFAGADSPDQFQVQMRVPAEPMHAEILQHEDGTPVLGSWMTADGSRVADPKGYYEIIYNPVAAGD